MNHSVGANPTNYNNGIHSDSMVHLHVFTHIATGRTFSLPGVAQYDILPYGRCGGHHVGGSEGRASAKCISGRSFFGIVQPIVYSMEH